MQFKNNDPRLEEEFHDDKLHPLLRGCVLDLARFVRRTWDKSLVITCIYRDPIRQRNLCQANKTKSGWRHCFWAAIDMRSRNFTGDEVVQILRYSRETWESYCRLRYHTKGTGKHFHVQPQDKFIDKADLRTLIENTESAEEWFLP